MRLDLLAALTGVLIAIQSRANGELAFRMHNALEAATISFLSGFLVMIVLTWLFPGIRQGLHRIFRAMRSKEISHWGLFGGALGGVAMAVQTRIVPLIGVAIYSVSVIAGQTGISLVVDRLGLASGEKKHLTPRRIVAALLTIAAVLISVWDRLDAKSLSAISIVLGVASGAVIGLQRALNGQVNVHSGQSFSTSLLNFITGTTLLIFLLLGGVVTHHTHLTGLVKGPWWMYLGGVTGLIYIAFSATVVQHLGVLTFTLLSVGGQLVGSLVIDFLSPSAGVHVGAYLLTGIFMTYLGVIANSDGALKRGRPGAFQHRPRRWCGRIGASSNDT
jgi:transporter family-2 protein